MGRNKKRVAVKKNIEEAAAPSLRDQFKNRRGIIILCLLAGASWLLAVYLLHLFTNIRVTYFMGDVVGVLGAVPLIGIFSTLGIIVLAATAGITWFGYALIRKKANNGMRGFLLYSALICTLMTLDDGLALHDHLFPFYFHIHERWTFLLYAVIAFLYVWRYWRQIVKTDYLIFVLACFFLGLSVSVDLFTTFSDTQSFIEDGFKFFGVFFWMAYFFLMVKQAVAEVSEC